MRTITDFVNTSAPKVKEVEQTPQTIPAKTSTVPTKPASLSRTLRMQKLWSRKNSEQVKISDDLNKDTARQASNLDQNPQTDRQSNAFA